MKSPRSASWLAGLSVGLVIRVYDVGLVLVRMLVRQALGSIAVSAARSAKVRHAGHGRVGSRCCSHLLLLLLLLLALGEILAGLVDGGRLVGQGGVVGRHRVQGCSRAILVVVRGIVGSHLHARRDANHGRVLLVLRIAHAQPYDADDDDEYGYESHHSSHDAYD